MSKRLSTILRKGGPGGSREATEVPTPYGGVYRRQNNQTVPNPYKKHGRAVQYQRDLTKKQAQVSSPREINTMMRKSNKAGRQTRRVLSQVDKLLPLMHNLLGALQNDDLEPRPYAGRRDTWAPPPDRAPSNARSLQKPMHQQPQIQDQVPVQNQARPTTSTTNNTSFYDAHTVDTKSEEIVTPAPPIKSLTEKSNRRGTFVQLDQDDGKILICFLFNPKTQSCYWAYVLTICFSLSVHIIYDMYCHLLYRHLFVIVILFYIIIWIIPENQHGLHSTLWFPSNRLGTTTTTLHLFVHQQTTTSTSF